MHNTDNQAPIDYLAIEFPDGQISLDGFLAIQAQVEAKTLYVLDIEFIRRGEDGSMRAVPAGSLGDELVELERADAGLLDRADIEMVGAKLSPGGILLVIVYENLAINPALLAWESTGARILAEGPVDLDHLEVALAI